MEKVFSFSDLVVTLSSILDLTLPYLIHHHRQVGYIAFSMAKRMNLKEEKMYNILIAGLLHDIGVVIHKEKEKIALREFKFYQKHKILYLHSYVGYLLLKQSKPFKKIADIVCFHHIDYKDFQKFKKRKFAVESNFIHLADRVSILINPEKEILSQSKEIRKFVQENSGKMFAPELVNVFNEVSRPEQFWLDLVNPHIDNILLKWLHRYPKLLNLEEMGDFSEILCKIVDFRSHFTASHSSGVATCSEILAYLLNFSKLECKLMKYAGLIHDIGKLSIPIEILEKPSKLTEEEKNIIKRHPFYPYRIMEDIPEINPINEWAFLHHERMDGSGYPFGLQGDFIPTGSRIIAIADIFTALSEERPYRKGMNISERMEILKDLSEKSAIDKKIVSILEANIEKIESARKFTYQKSIHERKKFLQQTKYEDFLKDILK